MKENNEHISNIDLFTRYLAKETSAEENKQLAELLGRDKKALEEFSELKKVWHGSGIVSTSNAVNVESEWNKLQQSINPVKSISKKRNVLSTAIKIAAVFVVGFISAYWVYQSISSETYLAGNTIKAVTLKDGSVVTLNKNSELKVLAGFNKATRKVTLEGEAFFNIERNESNPFVISVFSNEVTVLGTSFNVKGSSPNAVEVNVKTGKVSFKNTKIKQEVLLAAGEQGISKGNQITKQEISNINYLSWKTKVLEFKNISLQDVVYDINKAYNCNIVIESEVVKNCHITTKFEEQSLSSVLEVLESLLDISIQQSQDKIVIKGNAC